MGRSNEKGRKASDASPFLPASAHRVHAKDGPRRQLYLQPSVQCTTTTTATKAATTATTTTTTVIQKRSIDKQAMAQLPPLTWQGPVHVLKTRHDMQAAVEQLLQQETILGFDTETKPAFRKGQYEPPALVQLAGEHCVYLFQILQGGLDILIPLLQAKHIIKVGVAIQRDIKELQQVLPFTPAGFVELADRTKQLGYPNAGLRALSAMMLGGNLNKKAQTSNWAHDVLTERQVKYAATDAWVGRELYLRVLEEEEGKAQNA